MYDSLKCNDEGIVRRANKSFKRLHRTNSLYVNRYRLCIYNSVVVVAALLLFRVVKLVEWCSWSI
jgi:hypothetical protein